MSTLITENLQDVGGSVPVATVRQGSAKAWLNLNGTGTISPRDSFNTASVTDNGTGTYTQNFTAAMPNANYMWALGGSASTGIVLSMRSDLAAPTTTAIIYSTYNSALALVDGAHANITINGDA